MSKLNIARAAVAVIAMAGCTLTFSPAAHAHDTAAQSASVAKVQSHRESILRPGEALTAGQILQSENKAFGFWLNPSGDVVRFQWVSEERGKILWKAGLKNVAKVSFDAEGILRFLDKEGIAVYISDAPKVAAGAKAVLRVTNAGDVVIEHDGKKVWTLGGGEAIPQPQPEGDNVLSPGKSLTFGQGIYSPNKRYVLAYRQDGNLAVADRTENETIWRTFLDKPTAKAKLLVNVDGNVTLVDAANAVLWQTGTGKNGAVDKPRLILRDSGALEVLHGAALIWSTAGESSTPGSILKPGMEIKRGESIASSNGKFSLQITDAGALMIVAKGVAEPVWEAGLKSGHASKLSLTAKGNLELRSDQGKLLWESGSAGEKVHNPRAILRANGVLEVLHGDKVVWRSHKAA